MPGADRRKKGTNNKYIDDGFDNNIDKTTKIGNMRDVMRGRSQSSDNEEPSGPPDPIIETKMKLKDGGGVQTWSYQKTFDYRHQFEAFFDSLSMVFCRQAYGLDRLVYRCRANGCMVRMIVQQSSDGEQFHIYSMDGAEHKHPPLEVKNRKVRQRSSIKKEIKKEMADDGKACKKNCDQQKADDSQLEVMIKWAEKKPQPLPIPSLSDSNLSSEQCAQTPAAEDIVQVTADVKSEAAENAKNTEKPSAKGNTAGDIDAHVGSSSITNEVTVARKIGEEKPRSKWRQIGETSAAEIDQNVVETEYAVKVKSAHKRRIMFLCDQQHSTACEFRLQLIKDPVTEGWKIFTRGSHTHDGIDETGRNENDVKQPEAKKMKTRIFDSPLRRFSASPTDAEAERKRQNSKEQEEQSDKKGAEPDELPMKRKNTGEVSQQPFDTTNNETESIRNVSLAVHAPSTSARVMLNSSATNFSLAQHQGAIARMFVDEEMPLSINEDRGCLIIRSNYPPSRNRVLIFTDEGNFIEVNEFIDNFLVQGSTSQCVKLDDRQFLRAVHEKCLSFFFDV